jgi:hypothetical protein
MKENCGINGNNTTKIYKTANKTHAADGMGVRGNP